MRTERRSVSDGDDVERLLPLARIGDAPELQRLDEHADAGERRAQVVGDLVHEVGLQPGDVGLAVEHDQRADGAEDGGADERQDEGAEDVVLLLAPEDQDEDAHGEHHGRGDDHESDDERVDAPELHGASVARRGRSRPRRWRKGSGPRGASEGAGSPAFIGSRGLRGALCFWPRYGEATWTADDSNALPAPWQAAQDSCVPIVMVWKWTEAAAVSWQLPQAEAPDWTKDSVLVQYALPFVESGTVTLPPQGRRVGREAGPQTLA